MTQIEVHESAWQRWGVRLLPALTFLLGLALAGFVVSARGPGGGATAAGGEPTASASPSSGSAATSDDTVVTVPGACQDAAAKITEATRLIDDVVVAVRDFQPQELVDLLTRLEDLDAETRPLAEECSAVDVSASSDASPSATPDDEATPEDEASPGEEATPEEERTPAEETTSAEPSPSE